VNDDNKDWKRGEGLMGGLILIALGVAFLLGQQGLFGVAGVRDWWPLIVVAIGVGKLVGGGSGRRRRGGLWMVFVGLWLLANVNHYFGLDWHNSWPIMVIGGGVMMTLGALYGDSCRRSARSSSEVSHVE
jgi:hypothetical protein